MVGFLVVNDRENQYFSGIGKVGVLLKNVMSKKNPPWN